MQVGIDVGATKIESVVLEENGNEKHRSRISCPKEYTQIITAIRDIHRKLEQEFKKDLPIGVCHPGVHSPQTGLVKNCLLYTSPSPRDVEESRMPSSA